MSRRPRRNHLSEFKAKVALEATKDGYTLAELAKRYDVHRIRLPSVLERVAEVFDRPSKAAAPPVDVTVLYAKIGELTLENDFFKVRSQKRVWLRAKR